MNYKCDRAQIPAALRNSRHGATEMAASQTR